MEEKGIAVVKEGEPVKEIELFEIFTATKENGVAPIDSLTTDQKDKFLELVKKLRGNLEQKGNPSLLNNLAEHLNQYGKGRVAPVVVTTLLSNLGLNPDFFQGKDLTNFHNDKEIRGLMETILDSAAKISTVREKIQALIANHPDLQGDENKDKRKKIEQMAIDYFTSSVQSLMDYSIRNQQGEDKARINEELENIKKNKPFEFREELAAPVTTSAKVAEP
ncbi:MAG TPA: hypothetical protein VJC08_00460, partial [bacterium]|nr:hypothetical protein [bacterium]